MFDLLIRNAEVIDGTGAAAFRGDVAVRAGRVVAVGEVRGRARETLDAGGRTLAPGFVDPHSHADLILPLGPERQAELLRCKLAQGITTTIVGNCGLGAAPVTDDAEPVLRGVNAWMTPEPAAWPWRSTREYLERLDAGGLALNVAALVPHGPARISSMGLRAGAPTKRELARTRRLVEEGLEAGAVGLSSGLIYPPGMYTPTSELVELARPVARAGGVFTSHVRGSSELLLRSVEELVEIGRASGCAVHHSHSEAVGRRFWPDVERALALEDRARTEGVRLTHDMFPYDAAATMMVAIYPPWSLEGGVDRLLERLGSARERSRIRRDIERVAPSWPPWRENGWPHNLVMAVGWEGIEIGYVEGRANKRFEGLTLAELGDEAGKHPFDAISDLLVEERGRVSMLVWEISGEEQLERIASHPLCAFCTDAEDYGRGRPHPAAYGAFARVLGRFVRGRKLFGLEEAVRRMTSLPADIFKLEGRGRIRPGAFADLVLFDRERVADRATFRSPRREPRGVLGVWVNGRKAFDGERVVTHDAGRVVRRSEG